MCLLLNSLPLWALFSVYGPPYEEAELPTWNVIQTLVQNYDTSWLLIGDLNETLNHKDKRGGKRGQPSFSPLSNFVLDVGAINIGFRDTPFTWCKKHCGLANIRQRLGRALCDANWQLLYLEANVFHLPTVDSDHLPLLLDTSSSRPPKGPKLFSI